MFIAFAMNYKFYFWYAPQIASFGDGVDNVLDQINQILP